MGEINPRFNSQFVFETSYFILKNKSITFDPIFFLYIKGTAMWPIFAPTYANTNLNTNLIKSKNLVTILNQINPNLQFTMERRTTNSPFLDNIINKTGNKIWLKL